MIEVEEKTDRRLTSGRLLARNTIWNLLGNGAPMLVAVVCIPILIRGLGKDRFGVLTLAWALVGYASLFDLGLGRALTQLVAHKLGAGKDHEIPSVVWTSLSLMLLLGIGGYAILWLTAPLLVSHGLKVPPSFQQETMEAFRLLGISVPFVITTAGLRGLLEAHQRFRLIAALRIPMGISMFAGPLVVLPFSRSLVPVVATLVVGRILLWAAYLLLCLRVMPDLWRSKVWERRTLRPLLSFGGWMTVSNIVNPVLVSMDRFIVGAVLPVAMVGFYTAPFEAVTKLWMIPTSLTATVFPACSVLGKDRKKELEMLYCRCIKYLFLVLAPISLVLCLFARQIIQVWLGPDFASKSTPVLQILSVGVFINCFAHIPYCFIQGLGRPDVTARLFVAEVLPYAGFIWLMVHHGGIVGAATAWSIRAAIEVLLLLLIAWRLYSLSPYSILGVGTARSAVALCALGIAMLGTKMALENSLRAEVIVSALWLLLFAMATWKYVFDDSDRISILGLVDPLRNASRSQRAVS